MTDPEHLDVLVVGAGLSGVCAGHHLQESAPWASYAIFESRAAIGGTWDLFRYPGVRSDSDMYTLGFPFRPWNGDTMIVDGDEIRRYIEDTAREEGIAERIRFHHRVVRIEWQAESARWLVTAERSDTGEKVQVTCGFILSCTGYYRYDHGYEPEFEGREAFQGRIVHPQHWPQDLDHTGAQVVVIGSGATAVTLVPSMARDAAHVTMLQRSPTYVATVPRRNPVARLLHRVGPGDLGATVVRWAHALGAQATFRLSKRYPGAVRRLLLAGVKLQLPKGYAVDPHFTPTYNPWDERICAVPNGELFTAITDGSASVVTDHIERFTETGVRLRNGDHLDADIIVTATGLELLFLGGMEVVVDGEHVDIAERLAYKGMMLEGVPNLAFAIGYTNASWTLKCDLTCRAVTRLLDHMRRERHSMCRPVNVDPTVVGAPLLGLDSGYVKRAAGRMPQQGSRFPWQVYQSFLRDYRAMTLRAVADEGLVFSDPTRASDVADVGLTSSAR